MLLENVRFEPGEEKNDENLSKEFASLAEIYVNECICTAIELIVQQQVLQVIYQQFLDF